MDWQFAPDIKAEIKEIIRRLDFKYIDPKRLAVFRSYGSCSRARARIWGLPRIWQKALKTSPSYCIEVLSEKFDCLSLEDKRRVLIHELMHIPKNFSGSLLSHRGRGRRIGSREVEKLFNVFCSKQC